MNDKNANEAYIALLQAKEKVARYCREKVKNKAWQPYHNGIVEQLDDIIADYAITTQMSEDEIMSCLYEVGAYDESSIYYDVYCTMKKNI